MVAGRAGGDQIVPGVAASQVAWDDMINGQLGSFFAAVLAGVIVPPEDLLLAEFDRRARAFDIEAEADD